MKELFFFFFFLEYLSDRNISNLVMTNFVRTNIWKPGENGNYCSLNLFSNKVEIRVLESIPM